MQFTLFCWHYSLPFLRPLVNFWCCFFSCRSVLVILHQRQQVYEARVHDGWTYCVCCRNSHKHSGQESWKLLSASLLICGMWLEQGRPYPRSCREYQIHDMPLFLWKSDFGQLHQMLALWPGVELWMSRRSVSLNHGKSLQIAPWQDQLMTAWQVELVCIFVLHARSACLYSMHLCMLHATCMIFTIMGAVIATLGACSLCGHLVELLWPCSESAVCHFPHDRGWHAIGCVLDHSARSEWSCVATSPCNLASQHTPCPQSCILYRLCSVTVQCEMHLHQVWSDYSTVRAMQTSNYLRCCIKSAEQLQQNKLCWHISDVIPFTLCKTRRVDRKDNSLCIADPASQHQENSHE